MAIHFPMLMDLQLGETRGKRDPKYQVEVYRKDNRMVIAISDGDHDHWAYYRRTVRLKDHWWSLRTLRDKIMEYTAKAEMICDKLNHNELFMNHEAESATR